MTKRLSKTRTQNLDTIYELNLEKLSSYCVCELDANIILYQSQQFHYIMDNLVVKTSISTLSTNDANSDIVCIGQA